MEYKDLVKDFATRTKANLALIRTAAKTGQDAYEVTQFINSLLGLLIFPQQEFYEKIPRAKLADLEKDGWPIPRVCDNYKQVKDLSELARYLRNSIAHFNLRFTQKDEHVDGVIIWNTQLNGQINWKAELTIVELEGITDKFAGLLLKG
jgi:hypothetical protein